MIFMVLGLQEPLQFLPCGQKTGILIGVDQRNKVVEGRQVVSLEPEDFPDSTLYLIPGYCTRDDLLRDSHQHAGITLVVPDPPNDEPTTPRPWCRAQKFCPLVAGDSCRSGKPAPGLHTAKRARPLARRARKTARPPRVFRRARNPWVRWRRVLDG